MAVAYVALGANLGDAVAQVEWALEELQRRGPTRASSLYRTEPLGDPDQPWYVNAVARHETALEPEALLAALEALERRAGRPAERPRWVARTLDLDLLLLDDRILDTPRLTLPHPGLARRRFVLEPLVELDPAVLDPRTGRTAASLLAALDDPLRVEKLSPPADDGRSPHAAGAAPRQRSTAGRTAPREP